MARNWREIRAEAVATGKLDETRVAAERRHIEQAQAIHQLAELRKELGMLKQVQIAEVMGVSQARVSKIERGDLGHTELGTLQSYVAALGGELRVSVELGDGKSILLGQEDDAPATGPRSPRTPGRRELRPARTSATARR